jgi:hypothetical protein
MKRASIILIASLALVITAHAEPRPDLGVGVNLLPDAKLTPGAATTNDVSVICQKRYAGSERNVPESVKRAVYAEYGITKWKPGEYEIDHLISLELGGSNDKANLWPQPYQATWNAHQKDHLEDRLHALVCQGKIPLAQAQAEISTNWIAAFQKYVGGGATDER